jgi:hypothetical protein
MTPAILSITQRLDIHAVAAPPRDRTSRTDRALDHCKSEWQSAFDLAKEKGLATTKALRMAAVAYQLAMPEMDSLPTIRAAIACIAEGIQLEVLDGLDGSQLLCAAQVALSVLKQKDTKHAQPPSPRRR